jgi:hypothetical protein
MRLPAVKIQMLQAMTQPHLGQIPTPRQIGQRPWVILRQLVGLARRPWEPLQRQVELKAQRLVEVLMP